MNSNIPVVIVHRGYKNYLENNIKITSKKNYIYLIGDESLAHLENKFENLTFINIKELISSKILNFKEHFINYSTNEADFEWYCFERIFIMEEFIKKYNFEKVFHIDSDNILLVDINDLKFSSNTAYLIPSFQKNYRMDSSIHSSLLDRNFFIQFTNLYKNIYINKSEFELIEKKINYHKLNNIKGGVCDMTLYFLLNKRNQIEIQNLMKPIYDKYGNKYIFINNLNLSEGYKSKKNFKMKRNIIKIYNNQYIFDLIKKEKIKIANIHFQGSSKKYLTKFATLKY